MTKSTVKPDEPYFISCALEDVKCTLDDWIAHKVINSIALFKIIDYINHGQNEVYKGRQTLLSPHNKNTIIQAVTSVTPYHGGMFDVAKKMRSAIMSQFEGIIGLTTSHGYQPNVDEINETLDIYNDIWRL